MSGRKQMQLTLKIQDATPTVEASCPHPFEGQPVAVSETPRPIYCLPIAGYASQHAATREQGARIGKMSAFMRQFDRDRGQMVPR